MKSSGVWGWRRQGQRQWDGWSRMLPGGGAEAVQHTFSLLERISELWFIGGKQRDLHRQDHRNVTITSGEESWKGGFKETEGIKVYIIKEDLRSLRL